MRKRNCKGRWYNEAWNIIEDIDKDLPSNASRETVIKELRGCPFPGSWPVKAWYRARKEYLNHKFPARSAEMLSELTPLERYIKEHS